MASVKITFIGHASFRFESDKSVTYFDAWFDDNPTAKMKLSQVRKADIAIASHGHGDHIGDGFRLGRIVPFQAAGIWHHVRVYGPRRHRRDPDAVVPQQRPRRRTQPHGGKF